MSITAHMKLATAQRQLDHLRRHLPRLVEAGRLSADLATVEIETMQAIVSDCQHRARQAEARYDDKYGSGAWTARAVAREAVRS